MFVDNSKCLSFGDSILLEVKKIDEVQNVGSFMLGSENLKFSSDRLTEQLRANDNFDVLTNLAAVTPIQHGHTLPIEFFSNCIIEILYGTGNEAQGKAIKYGNHIAFFLRKSRKFFRTKKDSIFIELDGASSYNGLGKEYYFKIAPKHKNRSDGDIVHFGDVITLVDFLGRTILCDRLLRAINESSCSAVLKSGHIVQFLHKEFGSLLAATSYGPQQDQLRVEAIPTTSGLPPDTCSGIWEIQLREDAITDRDQLISRRSKVVLRHLLSDQFLSFDDRGRALLAATGSLLELRSLPVFRDSRGRQTPHKPGARSQEWVLKQSPVRLLHCSSGRFVALRSDQPGVFSLADRDFDQDVFQLLLATSADVEHVTRTAICRRSLGQLLGLMSGDAAKQTSPSPPLSTVSSLSRSVALLLDRFAAASFPAKEETPRFRFRQNVLNEMHFPRLLLQAAEKAFAQLQAPNPASLKSRDLSRDSQQSRRDGATQLMAAAYALLTLLLSGNFSSVEAVLAVRGSVRQMLLHQAAAASTARAGLAGGVPPAMVPSPPLMRFVETSKLAPLDRLSSLQLVSLEEIRVLLDDVYDSILLGKVPGQFPYQFLAKVCSIIDFQQVGESSAGYINQSLQLKVCEQVLGASTLSSHPETSPFWSAMVYRTFIHEDVLPTGQKKRKLLISTSSFGQCRPSTMSAPMQPIKPTELADSLLDAESWSRLISKRNSTSHLIIDPAELAYHAKNETEDHPALHVLSSKVEWKELTQLSPEEAGFYCSTLDLLASLCSGRNLLTQSTVRSLLPVDHILLALQIDPLENKELVAIQAAFLKLLLHLYVDSAALPPLPSNALDSLLDGQGHFSEDRAWDDVFEDECCNKLFSISSQVADDTIEVSGDMTGEELWTSFAALNCPRQRMLNDGSPSFDEWMKMKPDDLNKNSADTMEFLRTQKQVQRIARAAQNIRGLRQRAALMSIVLHFLETTMPLLWGREVEAATWGLFCSTSSRVSESRRSKSLRLKEAVHIAATNTTTSNEICRNAQYSKNMLLLIHALLLRRFFDDDYNAIPTFITVSQPFRSDANRALSASDEAKEYGESSPSSYFYNLKAIGSDYEIVDFFGNSGQQLKIVQCISLNHSASTFTAPLRVITNKMLMIIKFFHFDEKEFQEIINKAENKDNPNYFFNARFGYKTGNFQVIKDHIDVKMLSCKVLVLCMERFFSRTSLALWSVFKPSYDKLLPEFLTESKINESVKESLSVSKKFRARLWRKMETKLKSDCNLVWCISDFFREDSFHSLLQLVLYKSAELRTESLCLIYKINACRAELASYLMESFKNHSEASHGKSKYISIKRKSLQSVLAHFKFDSDDTDVPHILPQHAPDGKSYRHLMQRNIFQLRGLLFRNDDDTDLGLAVFCRSKTELPTGNNLEESEMRYILSFSACSAGVQLLHPASAENQEALYNAGICQIITDFLCLHVEKITGSSKATVAAAQTIFRACFRFLRELIKDNINIAKSVGDRVVFQMIMKCAMHCHEACYLLIDFVKLNNQFLRLVSEMDFESMLQCFSLQVTNLATTSVEDIITNLCTISSIVSQSSETAHLRMLQFVTFLNTKSTVTASDSIMDTIMVFGFGVSSLSSSVGDECYGVGGYSFEAHQSLVDRPILYMCRQYISQTDRATFCRHPRDVLADPIVDSNVITKLQSIYFHAKLLSPSSELFFHLQFVYILGALCVKHKSLRSLCKTKFGSYSSLACIIFIDQVEIRMSYIKLLHGLWFSDKDAECDDQDGIKFDSLRALFYLFVQDLRSFFMCRLASSVQHKHRSEQERLLYRRHIDLISRYLSLTLLPCVRACLLCNAVLKFELLQVEASAGISSFVLVIENLLQDYELIVSESGDMALSAKLVLEAVKIWNSKLRAEHAIKPINVLKPSRGFLTPAASVQQSGKSLPSPRQLNFSRGLINDEETKKQTIFNSCLNVLIETTADFSFKFGYLVDHLVTVKDSDIVFVENREYPVDSNKFTRTKSILNPLNSKTLGFTIREMSRHVLSYARAQFESEVDDLTAKIKCVDDPIDFGFVDLQSTDRKVSKRSIKRPQELSKVVVTSEGSFNSAALLCNASFLTWSENGGIFPRIIMEHIMNCLVEAQNKDKNCASLVLSGDVYRSNAYWIDVFTKGILKSRLELIFDKEFEKEENRSVLRGIENSRLQLMQEVFKSISALDLVVQHMSLPRHSLERILSVDNIDFIQSMAVGLGISLIESGTTFMQDAFVKAISGVENTGEKNNFLLSIRASLQYYRHKVAVLGDINPLSVTHVVRLLRFLSLLCEGHNHTAQIFLAKNNVVSEVASFVEEISNVLSTEMNLYFAADDLIARDNLPVIGGHKVAVIQWIGSDAKLIDLNKLTLLVEVVRQGFETLSEFCQGFVFENQATIARAGSFKHLQVFSKFFGAYQLVVRSTIESDSFYKSYRDKLKVQLTHESVVKLNTVTQTKLLWLGNDPYAQMALFEYYKKNVRSQSTRASGTFKYVNRGLEKSPIPMSVQLDQMESLAVEKKKYLGSLCDDEETDVSQLEGNTYYRIMRFGEELTKLESSSLKLVQSVLEGSRIDEDEEICRIAFSSLGTANLIICMTNYWNRFRNFKTEEKYRQKVKVSEHCFERQMAFDYYALAKRFCDMPRIDTNELEVELADTLGKLKIRVDEYIARIEVREPDTTALSVAYFPIPSLIRRYWDNSGMEELRQEILFPPVLGTRDTIEEKITSFLRDGKFLLAALRHFESLDEYAKLHRNVFYVFIQFAKRMESLNLLTLNLTIVLNILMIISLKDTDTSFEIKGNLFVSLIYYFGFAHLGSCGLTLFCFFVLRGMLIVKEGVKENGGSVLQLGGLAAELLGPPLGLLYGDKAVLAKNKVSVPVWPTFLKLFYLFSHFETHYYLALTLCSVLGVLRSPLWFACCLMEVLRVSKLMQYVLRAFTANVDQVIAAVLLAALITYSFSVAAYSTSKLHNKFNFDGMGSTDNNQTGCSSLSGCTLLALNYGSLQSVFWQEDPQSIGTVEASLFNFGFVFILQIVVPGLISGIIIDTFSDMRGYKNAIEQDVFNTCFICNISREDFESSGVPFQDHVKGDHNMWKYLWFLVYLSEKDPTEFTGVEQFCQQAVDRQELRWLPIKAAKALSQIADKYDLYSVYHQLLALQRGLGRAEERLRGETRQQDDRLRQRLAAATRSSQEEAQQLRALLEKTRLLQPDPTDPPPAA